MRTILFILSLIIIVGVSLFVYKKGNPFSSDTKVKTSITKLTPDELVNLAKNCNPDFIAGECQNKGAFFHTTYQYVNGAKNNYLYTNYFVKGDHDADSYRKVESWCKEDMIEKLTYYQGEARYFYTIKNKENYFDFITYLESIKDSNLNSVEKSVQLGEDHGIFYNECVFFPRGYNIDQNGYTICIMTKEVLFPKQIEEKPVENNEVKEEEVAQEPTPSYCFVKVNEAVIHDYAGQYGEICSLKKGAKLKIIKKEDDYYYCDFTDNQGEGKTGYINEVDITFKKNNKHSEEEVPQE